MGARARDWLAGLVAGVFGGVLTFVVPFIGYAGLVGFIVIAVSRRRPYGLSGLLKGWGGAWSLLLVRSLASCAQFDAGVGRSCVAPDLTPWFLAAAALLAAGVALFVVLVRRDRTNRPMG